MLVFDSTHAVSQQARIFLSCLVAEHQLDTEILTALFS